MRILVTYGSKRGGTEGLAQMVGQALADAGHQVDVRPAGRIDGLGPWEGVVVGGALYASRWHRDARRFVQRHEEELRQRPVWFFSSGPLDDSATKGGLAPTPQVRRLMERVNARGHATFGGRLEPTATGFIVGSMVKQGRAGDWRDPEAVKAWGHTVAAELSALPPSQRVAPVAVSPAYATLRHLLGVLCLAVGITALWGGIELMGWPRGGAPRFDMPLSVLDRTPFRDFFVPGLLLFFCVGLSNLIAGVRVLRRHRGAERLAFVSGGVLTVWIVTEMGMLRSARGMEWLYLAAGLVIMAVALWLRRSASRRPAHPHTLVVRGLTHVAPMPRRERA